MEIQANEKKQQKMGDKSTDEDVQIVEAHIYRGKALRL